VRPGVGCAFETEAQRGQRFLDRRDAAAKGGLRALRTQPGDARSSQIRERANPFERKGKACHSNGVERSDYLGKPLGSDRAQKRNRDVEFLARLETALDAGALQVRDGAAGEVSRRIVDLDADEEP
jgi:hypothetical protein